MVSLKVLKADGVTKFVSHGDRETYLVATSEYEEGDRIVLEYAGEPKYFYFQADDALGEALILVKGNVEFKIPFGEAKTSYSPKAFSGACHYLHAREALDYEVYVYRNQAVNVYDNHENNTSFPHATANVETRNEAVFAARNAIDGVKANSSHGQWPYTSWGINRNPDALIRIDFGNAVEVDKAVIYLRADFPHDNWWNEVTLEFSDGSVIKANLVKTHEAQEVCFEKRKVTWVEMKNLIKAESESPFPALTQLEIYGTVYKFK
jgi:hypothetical protein